MSASPDRRIQVLLPEELWKAYRLYCFEKNISMSEEIRDYIKRVTMEAKN
jgi:hypothetical protein